MKITQKSWLLGHSEWAPRQLGYEDYTVFILIFPLPWMTHNIFNICLKCTSVDEVISLTWHKIHNLKKHKQLWGVIIGTKTCHRGIDWLNIKNNNGQSTKYLLFPQFDLDAGELHFCKLPCALDPVFIETQVHM